jgi:hypothetical protein
LLVLTCALGALLALPAGAVIGTVDDVPAATLLLPYFEVDLEDPAGITTLFSINNASASAAIAHVTLWTDMSIPTLDFDIYLTGYDVQTLNLRDIFNGILPLTADALIDSADTGNPNDGISNKGVLSQDINFPGTTGPCGTAATIYSAPLSGQLIAHLRASHTGQESQLYEGCLAADYGDDIARGYVTVDTVSQCNLSFPSDAGYFAGGIAENRNILWGDYFYVEPGQDFAQGETLVHVEACGVGTGAVAVRFPGAGPNQCPFTIGDYTFYARYAAVAGQDQREALATTFAARYLNGGPFSGGTDLVVWRDAKTIPTGANGVFECGGAVSWFPLNQADVVSFDEQENPTDLCFRGSNVSPPTGGFDTCFPLEAQRVSLQGGNVVADDPNPPALFGWIYLNLNTAVAGGAANINPLTAQAWVTVVMSAEGRYSVGFDAIQLDQANETAFSDAPGGRLLIP